MYFFNLTIYKCQGFSKCFIFVYVVGESVFLSLTVMVSSEKTGEDP